MENKDKKIGKKILKVILWVMIIFIIMFIINVARNFSILGKVLEKEKAYVSSNNLYYEITNNSDRNYSKFYKKDGVEMYDMIINKNRIISWRNTNTNEGLRVFPNSKIAIKAESNEMLGFSTPLLVYTLDEIDAYKYYISVSSIIYSEKVDNKECYVIMRDFNNKTWIDKETGVVVKRQSGTVQNANNEKSPLITYYKNWKINELTDEDVAKPDISDYEIKEDN